MEVLAPEAERAAGPRQYGLRTSDGAVAAYSVLDNALKLNPKLVIACVDIKGAHSNIRLDKLEEICNAEAPRLAQLLRIWYHKPSPKTWRGAKTCSRESATGVGQGFPEAGGCFCAGMGRLIGQLEESSPDTTVVAFQDDTYVIAPISRIPAALATVRSLWATLGLEINDAKLKLYTGDPSVKNEAPDHLQSRFVDSLPVLGQRIALQLAEEGLGFTVATGESGLPIGLAAAFERLSFLAARLRQVSAAGLPIAIAHKIWVFASSAAITHLQAASFCTQALMLQFQGLQRDHLRWISGREPSKKDFEVACLPEGLGLPDHVGSALTNFLAGQSRVLPGVCSALGIPTVEELMDKRVDLRAHLQAARTSH